MSTFTHLLPTWKELMNVFHQSNRTRAEQKLAEALRKKKIRFAQNQHLGTYEIDFWLKEYNLIIEVDGFTHLSFNQVQADQYKDHRLIDHGYIILRFTNEQIRENLAWCVQEIERVIKTVKSNRQTDGSINNSWKKGLLELDLKVTEPEPECQTIEEYFLRVEKNSSAKENINRRKR
jgi:very-short-patch-repair endonuclease